MLTGIAASGKTAALTTAADTLRSQGSEVEVHRVFPGAFHDVSSLIGRFSEGGAWEDGVCLSLIRRGLTVSEVEFYLMPTMAILFDTHRPFLSSHPI